MRFDVSEDRYPNDRFTLVWKFGLCLDYVWTIYRMYINSQRRFNHVSSICSTLAGKNDESRRYWKFAQIGIFFQEVTKPIDASDSSVPCDDWFTSVLIKGMLQDPFRLTMTDTIRKNKKEIPLVIKIAGQTVPGSNFCHTQDLYLVSYTPRKRKIVLAVSSHLKTKEVTSGKPIIILSYNQIKGETYTFDQLCHAYTVSRRPNRWRVNRQQ